MDGLCTPATALKVQDDRRSSRGRNKKPRAGNGRKPRGVGPRFSKDDGMASGPRGEREGGTLRADRSEPHPSCPTRWLM